MTAGRLVLHARRRLADRASPPSATVAGSVVVALVAAAAPARLAAGLQAATGLRSE